MRQLLPERRLTVGVVDAAVLVVGFCSASSRCLPFLPKALANPIQKYYVIEFGNGSSEKSTIHVSRHPRKNHYTP